MGRARFTTNCGHASPLAKRTQSKGGGNVGSAKRGELDQWTIYGRNSNRTGQANYGDGDVTWNARGTQRARKARYTCSTLPIIMKTTRWFKRDVQGGQLAWEAM